MNIYEEYGKAMINLEIAQGKVNSLKQLIAEDIQKQQQQQKFQEPLQEQEQETKPETDKKK